MVSIGSEVGVEIVRVVTECRLLDSRSEEHVYWRRDGRGLAPGFYLARRGGAGARRTFNEDAEFRGPYRSRADAQAAMEELVARMEARGVARTNAAHC
ncbi:MAG TPA: hypothetical protein VIH11_08030 [Gemmatimonadaceae bacterium]